MNDLQNCVGSESSADSAVIQRAAQIASPTLWDANSNLFSCQQQFSIAGPSSPVGRPVAVRQTGGRGSV